MNAITARQDNSFLMILYYCCKEPNSMTKATYKRNHLIGNLHIVSKGESMTVMVGSMMIGRQVWLDQ